MAGSSPTTSEGIISVDWGKLRFFLGEVLANFTRNATMQATAIGTVAVTIVLLGAFLYTRATLADLTGHFLNKIEISVYLKDSVDDKGAAAVSTQFATDPRIISATYVPRKEGLQQMRDRLRGAVDTSLLTTNPLPNAFRVRVRTPEDVPAVAGHIAKIAGVASVNYAQDAVTKLLKTTALLGKIGLGIVIALIVTAAIIISNTIRLTVFARRREIAIMQLVGAHSLAVHRRGSALGPRRSAARGRTTRGRQDRVAPAPDRQPALHLVRRRARGRGVARRRTALHRRGDRVDRIVDIRWPISAHVSRTTA
jgi:cell division protein FtsX